MNKALKLASRIKHETRSPKKKQRNYAKDEPNATVNSRTTYEHLALPLYPFKRAFRRAVKRTARARSPFNQLAHARAREREAERIAFTVI